MNIAAKPSLKVIQRVNKANRAIVIEKDPENRKWNAAAKVEHSHGVKKS